MSPGPAPGSVWTAAALRWVLAGHPDPAPTPAAFATTWPEAVAGLRRHRVVQAVSGHTEHLGPPEPIAGRLHRLHVAETTGALLTLASTVRVSSALAAAGVRALIVKGVALAALQQRRPADRGAGDVDVWVHPDDRDRAVEVLIAEVGYALRPAQHRVLVRADGWRYRFHAWATPETVLVHPRFCDVDLHWRLMRSPAQLELSFDEAWRRSVPVAEIGPNVRSLCPADALVHVAHHGNKDAWAILRHVVDVVALVRAMPADAVTAAAAADRQVNLALGVAARLAPEIAALMHVPHGRLARHRRVRWVDEAWAECLASRLRLADRRAASGVDDARLRLALTSWQMRTAPNAAAALHPLAELLLPMKAIMAQQPLPVAVVRQLTGRLGRTAPSGPSPPSAG